MTRTYPPRLFVSLAVLALGLLTLAARPSHADGPTLHTARFGMPAVVSGDAIYVIGGCGPDGFLNSIEQISPATGTVTSIPTTLLHRRWHTAQASGPYLYVMGGVVDTDSTDALSSAVERYDTRTGKVDLMAPLPTPRRTAASVLSDSKIYVIGGSTDGETHEAGTVDIYDIKANTWSKGAPMPTPRECALAVTNGSIYAVGGYDGTNSVSTVEAYNIAQNKWFRLPNLPVVLSAHHMALDGDTLYTFGNYAVVDQVGTYNLLTGKYRTLTESGYLPSRHNAVVVSGGKAYVIGGNTASANSSALSSIQVFSLSFLRSL